MWHTMMQITIQVMTKFYTYEQVLGKSGIKLTTWSNMFGIDTKQYANETINVCISNPPLGKHSAQHVEEII